MLDTLAYAKRLRGAGFTEEQAETQASALYDAVTGLTATKLDVVEAKNEIKEAVAGEFTAVRREIGEFKEAVAGEFTAIRREIEIYGRRCGRPTARLPCCAGWSGLISL